MKKTTFNISFDEDKASALVLYLSQKGTTAEAELERALDALYTKTVPAGVREYIELRSGNTPTPAAPKPRKPKPPKGFFLFGENSFASIFCFSDAFSSRFYALFRP